MKKRLLKCLVVISTFFCAMYLDAAQTKPWTVLIYLAAANDLNPFALYDLDEMMRIGSNENVNIIVYLTLQQDGRPKTTRKLYITPGKLNQIGELLARDSGSVKTLQEALEWACTDYPSDHIAVVLWDHGSGPLNKDGSHTMLRGVCYDYDTGNYLTDRDCLQAFSWARDTFRQGKKFDVIAFDACLMATTEMAYTLAACADYMVASEETIPGDGFQYAYMMNPLANITMGSLEFARHIVASYKQEYAYTGTTDYTLSATDLNALHALVHNINAVAKVLTTQLKSIYKTTVKSTLRRVIGTSISFDSGTYIDLLHFYKNLLLNISGLRLSAANASTFKQLLNNGIVLFNSVIKANVMSTNYSNVGGLAMYMARYSVEPSYRNLYWTQYNPQWLNFLQAYVS